MFHIETKIKNKNVTKLVPEKKLSFYLLKSHYLDLLMIFFIYIYSTF